MNLFILDTIHISANPVFNPVGITILSTCGNVQVEFRNTSTHDPSNNFYPEWLIDGTDYFADSTILHYTFATGNHDVTFWLEMIILIVSNLIQLLIPTPTTGPSPINLGGDKQYVWEKVYNLMPAMNQVQLMSGHLLQV